MTRNFLIVLVLVLVVVLGQLVVKKTSTKDEELTPKYRTEFIKSEPTA